METKKQEYESKKNELKFEMDENIIKEEVDKHIKMYQDHVQKEADKSVQVNFNQEVKALQDQYQQKLIDAVAEHQFNHSQYSHHIFDYEEKIKKCSINLNKQLTERNKLSKELEQIKLDISKQQAINEILSSAANNAKEFQIYNRNWLTTCTKKAKSIAKYAMEYKVNKKINNKRNQIDLDKVTPHEKQIAELDGDIAALETDNKLLEDRVKELRKEIITYQKEIDDNKRTLVSQIQEKSDDMQKLIKEVKYDSMKSRSAIRDIYFQALTSERKKLDFETDTKTEESENSFYENKRKVLDACFRGAREWAEMAIKTHEYYLSIEDERAVQDLEGIFNDAWIDIIPKIDALISWLTEMTPLEEKEVLKKSEDKRTLWKKSIYEYIGNRINETIENNKDYKVLFEDRRRRRLEYYKKNPEKFKKSIQLQQVMLEQFEKEYLEYDRVYVDH